MTSTQCENLHEQNDFLCIKKKLNAIFCLKMALKTSRTRIIFRTDSFWMHFMNEVHCFFVFLYIYYKSRNFDTVCSLFIVVIVSGRGSLLTGCWIPCFWLDLVVFYCTRSQRGWCSSKHSCRKTRASLDVLQTIAAKMNGTVCEGVSVTKIYQEGVQVLSHPKTNE